MKSEQHVEELLQQRGLKKTPVRLAILRLFIQHNFALSASDIEVLVKARYDRIQPDRVTVYRTLSTFEKSGIIHKAPDEGYGVKYALCSEHCPKNAHEDAHVHFICHQCNHTYCLEDTHIPMIKLPGDYAVEGFSYTINGVCKTCKMEAVD